jgi:hypothetical protein
MGPPRRTHVALLAHDAHEERRYLMLSRRLSRRRFGLGAVVLGAGLAAASSMVAEAAPEQDPVAAVLPGPNQFVTGLDLECYTTPGPPLNVPITLSHLNPVLIGLGMPPHQVIVRELQQTCVPVSKNGFMPQAAAFPFIRQVALACYRVEPPPTTVGPTLKLRHLNPVLAGLPVHDDVLIRPEQLCVPVSLNGAPIPAEVLQLVRFIDLECYSTDPIGTHPSFNLLLRQLHPELVGFAPHPLTLVSFPRQMCVPVAKNGAMPPVVPILRWIDLEKFTASPQTLIPPFNVVLRHLNPLLAAFPPVLVTLRRADSLMVPVGKNGTVPPPP